MDNVVISNKGIALVQEVMYQAQMRSVPVLYDPQHNPTEDEMDLFNEVAANITDGMVGTWEDCCDREGIIDLKSDRAKEIFHEIYQNSV